MSDFDDAIGDMTTDLLTEAGGSFVYHRGTSSTAITMRKSNQPTAYIDSGNGSIIEVHPVDFICLTSALPFTVPKSGDTITGDGNKYELQPTTSEKVYRQISPQMTRLHTKRVK